MGKTEEIRYLGRTNRIRSKKCKSLFVTSAIRYQKICIDFTFAFQALEWTTTEHNARMVWISWRHTRQERNQPFNGRHAAKIIFNSFSGMWRVILRLSSLSCKVIQISITNVLGVGRETSLSILVLICGANHILFSIMVYWYQEP